MDKEKEFSYFNNENGLLLEGCESKDWIKIG